MQHVCYDLYLIVMLLRGLLGCSCKGLKIRVAWVMSSDSVHLGGQVHLGGISVLRYLFCCLFGKVSLRKCERTRTLGGTSEHGYFVLLLNIA